MTVILYIIFKLNIYIAFKKFPFLKFVQENMFYYMFLPFKWNRKTWNNSFKCNIIILIFFLFWSIFAQNGRCLFPTFNLLLCYFTTVFKETKFRRIFSLYAFYMWVNNVMLYKVYCFNVRYPRTEICASTFIDCNISFMNDLVLAFKYSSCYVCRNSNEFIT